MGKIEDTHYIKYIKYVAYFVDCPRGCRFDCSFD